MERLSPKSFESMGRVVESVFVGRPYPASTATYRGISVLRVIGVVKEWRWHEKATFQALWKPFAPSDIPQTESWKAWLFAAIGPTLSDGDKTSRRLDLKHFRAQRLDHSCGVTEFLAKVSYFLYCRQCVHFAGKTVGFFLQSWRQPLQWCIPDSSRVYNFCGGLLSSFYSSKCALSFKFFFKRKSMSQKSFDRSVYSDTSNYFCVVRLSGFVSDEI